MLDYLVIFATISSILGQNCDHLGVLLYKDLGCTPEYGEDKTCPIKYTCADLKPSHDDVCSYQGQEYKIGKFVDSDATASSCNENCFCEKKDSFSCSEVYCTATDLVEGCYPKYSHNECCSIGFECPPFKDKPRCIVNGREYIEGALLPPPENSCLRCICAKGFEGKYEEPFCKRIVCGVQLNEKSRSSLRKFCAPYYWQSASGAKCCPDQWICPEDNEEFTGDAQGDDVCKFGEKTLKVGQSFEKYLKLYASSKKEKKIICECVLPPLVTCHDKEE